MQASSFLRQCPKPAGGFSRVRSINIDRPRRYALLVEHFFMVLVSDNQRVEVIFGAGQKKSAFSSF